MARIQVALRIVGHDGAGHRRSRFARQIRFPYAAGLARFGRRWSMWSGVGDGEPRQR
jgi:hypothetical protein